MYKIEQSGWFLGRVLGPLLKQGLPLTGNVLKTVAKSVSIPLELRAAASATYAPTNKKMLGSVAHPSELAKQTTLIKKGVREIIKNEAREQKGGFLKMLLGISSASLLWNLLAGESIITVSEGTIKASQDF